MKLDTALYQMRSQPLAFLRHNLLTIAGASQSGARAFGIGAGYSTRAHVIGVRKGGAWNLYAQQVSSGSGPVTGSVQIV